MQPSTNAGEDEGTGKDSSLSQLGLQTSGTLEITVENSPKATNQSTPAKSLLGICLRDSTSYSTHTCLIKFMAALFTIARKLEQPKCPSTDK